jgi:hypothetical protein
MLVYIIDNAIKDTTQQYATWLKILYTENVSVNIMFILHIPIS